MVSSSRMIQWVVYGLLFTGLVACSGPANEAASQSNSTGTGQTLATSPVDTPFVTPTSQPMEASPTGSPAPLPVQPSPTMDPTPLPDPTQPPQTAASLPDPAGYRWQPVANGLDAPIGIASAGDGSGRLFILEQAGRIMVVTNGQVQDSSFLDISDRVVSQGSEQGLLGLAFHPQFAQNGYFYINYTGAQGATRISRFQLFPDQPHQADPGSEKLLLTVEQPYANHNGGVLAFGPDGYLYIGLGDGGSGGDPLRNGQSVDTLLGKILRVDVDNGDPYAIPPGNPFQETGRPEIWAYGLRNPWRFSFDRSTRDLWIGDVGQGSLEEVDFQPANSPGGENYGWNIMEGSACFNTPDCDQQGLTLPVFDYETHSAGSCAITGGYVYRGSIPEFQGIYLFGDYCSGRIWGLLPAEGSQWQGEVLFDGLGNITSFGEDEAGELYLSEYSGTILQLQKNE